MIESAPAAGAAAARSSTPKASWAFAEGEEIAPGKRAVRNLGGGTVFEAYLARDEERLANVVCKLVRPDQVTDARALRLLRREAGLLARLAHPAIVRSFGATLEGPRPHLLLEHIDKLTLRHRLRRRGPLPVERVIPMALRLGAALHYLAVEGLVHLDVKPGNVLLGAAPRLFDFSLARSVERAAGIQQPLGTTAYMAPEQCVPGKRGKIGPPADVWGLGMTLYEALTGQLAFGRSSGADSDAEQVRHPQLTRAPAPLPDGIPAELAQAIMQCLSPDPAARPAPGVIVAALQPLAAALAQRAGQAQGRASG